MPQGTPKTPDTIDYNNLSLVDFFKSHVTKDDRGYHLPSDAKEAMDPVKYELMNTEARRRTTEASLAKEKTARLELQAKLDAQTEFMSVPSLPVEEQEQLDALKYSDPDAWLLEVTQRKAEAEEEFNTKFNEAFASKKQALLEAESKLTAAEHLANFNSINENKLTEEMLQYDVPPRLHKALSEGTLSHEEYLQQAQVAVYGTKVVTNPPSIPNEPSFKGTPGAVDNKTQEHKTFDEKYADAKF